MQQREIDLSISEAEKQNAELSNQYRLLSNKLVEFIQEREDLRSQLHEIQAEKEGLLAETRNLNFSHKTASAQMEEEEERTKKQKALRDELEAKLDTATQEELVAKHGLKGELDQRVITLRENEELKAR